MYVYVQNNPLTYLDPTGYEAARVLEEFKEEGLKVIKGGAKGAKKGTSGGLWGRVTGFVLGALFSPEPAGEGEQEWLDRVKGQSLKLGVPLLMYYSPRSKNKDPNRPDPIIVFRALNRKDVENLMAGRDITAKNPSGPWSVTSHVAYGSKAEYKPGINDSWISTTINFERAKYYDKREKNGIVVIDLKKVTSPFKWALASLDSNHKDYKLAVKYAGKDQEFSVNKKIDRKAIIGWIPHI